MRVDSRVEDPLRNAFGAVVDAEVDDIEPALSSLTDEQIPVAVSYAMYVVSYVVSDVFTKPEEGAEVLARHIVDDVSSWFDIGSQTEVANFLRACATGDKDIVHVQRDDVPVFALIVAGYLLAHYRPDGMRWFEYLDRIWDYAEKLPEST